MKISKQKINLIKEKLKQKEEINNKEIENLIKKLGVEVKEIPQNFSNVDIEFSVFLKNKIKK
ncbi:MAG: hypothetical protein ACRCZO_13440 [Cetobacterium sp.]